MTQRQAMKMQANGAEMSSIQAKDATLRDTFALSGMAMIYSTAIVNENSITNKELAEKAYELADAMMAARGSK